MDIQEQTSSGIATRTLTTEERAALAVDGNAEARREICSEEFAAALTDADKIVILAKLHGLTAWQ